MSCNITITITINIILSQAAGKSKARQIRLIKSLISGMLQTNMVCQKAFRTLAGKISKAARLLTA